MQEKAEMSKELEKAEQVAEEVDATIERYRSVGKVIIDHVKTFVEMIRAAVRGENIPIVTIIAIAGALTYLIWPMDSIPDFIPGVGLLDDALVIGAVALAAKADMDLFKDQKKKEESSGTSD